MLFRSNQRAKLGFRYKGEWHYTITPIPLYIKRRRLLLDLLKPFIHDANNICDFGCGDGYYLSHFNKLTLGQKEFTGIDISEEMIAIASYKIPGLNLFKAANGIPDNIANAPFNLIYSIAVFAHIDDDSLLNSIFESFKHNLLPGGKLIIFEQVAPVSYRGKSFIRRTIKDYEDLIIKYGFKVQNHTLISFDCHRYFERYLAKIYYKYFCKGNSDHEKRIHANSQILFRLMSMFFLMFDTNPLKQHINSGWGNVFMVFENQTS